MWVLIAQRLAIDFIIDLVFFPFWWYSAGLRRVLLYLWDLFLFANSYLAPGLWLKNIFVPMYGQRDWQGRLTSFIVRFFNVIFRGIGLFFWVLILLLMLFLWLAFPAFVIYMLAQSFLP
ncbi:MAG: hypothetical protein ABII02_00550 [Candidatus Magasanikbacteria bacterium]